MIHLISASQVARITEGPQVQATGTWWDWGNGVWTQGFTIAKQALYCLSHSSSPFCSDYFGDGVCLPRLAELRFFSLFLFFFFAALGLEFRASHLQCRHFYHWSHSTSPPPPFFFPEIGALELFAWAGFELQSFLITDSWLARIIGKSHWHLAGLKFLNLKHSHTAWFVDIEARPIKITGILY
jgi:hypothetical protein